jgi:hypothetical protein
MLRIVNEETGKTALTVEDNGDIKVNDTKVSSEQEIKEAIEKAKEEE